MSVRILAVGDVCGQPGLDFLEKRLKEYKKEQNIAFAVVNGENANVVGITPRQESFLFWRRSVGKQRIEQNQTSAQHL